MLKILGIFFIIFFKTYSLNLGPIDFDKKIENGKMEKVDFNLKNNSLLEKEYNLKIEESNIYIKPKKFRLKPEENKKFEIKIYNNNLKKGIKSYYLEIDEKIIDKPKKNQINLNKKYRIKQNYIAL